MRTELLSGKMAARGQFPWPYSGLWPMTELVLVHRPTPQTRHRANHLSFVSRCTPGLRIHSLISLP